MTTFVYPGEAQIHITEYFKDHPDGRNFYYENFYEMQRGLYVAGLFGLSRSHLTAVARLW